MKGITEKEVTLARVVLRTSLMTIRRTISSLEAALTEIDTVMEILGEKK